VKLKLSFHVEGLRPEISGVFIVISSSRAQKLGGFACGHLETGNHLKF
jgi:hypothetical protein